MSDEIKVLTEEVKKTVSDLQARNERLEEQGKTNSEGMEELKGNFDKLIADIEAINKEAAEEKAAREALELVVARTGNKNGDDTAGDPEYRKAFRSFLRNKSPIAVELQQKEVDALASLVEIDPDDEEGQKALYEMKSHLVGSNPDGGYLVPVDVRSEILRRIAELSPMRGLATSITTARDKVSFPIDDDLTINAYWAGELDTRDETDTAKMGVLDFPTHEQYAEPKVTNWMLEDPTINVEQFIRDKVASYFARLEASAFISGNGSQRPRGILNYPEAAVEVYERGKIGTRQTGTNDQYDADDFIRIQYNVIEDYQPGASWLLNRQTMAGVATLKASDGHYLLNPRVLFEGAQMVLLGKPVNFSPDMAAESNPAAATDGAKIAIYGDFREGYLIVDRLGLTVLRDPYTDKRFVKYSTRRRVGGGVKNFQSMKVLKVQ